jgi:hypothetical protein
MRIYTATSNADAAAWLRAQLIADDLDAATLDAWQAAVVERLVEQPLPRQLMVDVYTDGRLVRAAQIVGIELWGRWPDSLFVVLP